MSDWNTFQVLGNIAEVFDNGNNLKVLVITNYKIKAKDTEVVKEIARPNMLTIFKPHLQKFFRERQDDIVEILVKGELYDDKYEKDGKTHYITNRVVHQLKVTKWREGQLYAQDVPEEPKETDIPF